MKLVPGKNSKMEGVVAAKRLWHILRAVFFMLRRGISRKLMMDLHMMLKRGKVAGKAAIGNLMTFNLHSNFSCHSQDPHLAFFAPREYEFSCNNSPAFPFHFPTNIGKRVKNNLNQFNHHHRGHNKHSTDAEDDDEYMSALALQKTLELLKQAPSATASPVASLWPSRPVRQLRITDSPFPVKNGQEEVDTRVDDEAEEFINRFYDQLREQRTAAALEASYYNNLWSSSAIRG